VISILAKNTERGGFDQAWKAMWVEVDSFIEKICFSYNGI